MTLKRKLLLVLTGVLLTLLYTKAYWHSGFPYTHDGENHLARFANYKIALREGQLPPRWAPNLFSQYGYPVFNYNYPLANILSLPFSLVKFPYELTFKLIVTLSVTGGLVGSWFWLGHFAKNWRSHFFGWLVANTSWFLLSTIVFRGNIGEIMAWALLPWLLTVIDWQMQKQLSRLQVLVAVCVITAWLLAHNVSVIIYAPLLFIYMLFEFGKNYKRWLRAGSIFGIAGLLACWFWLPALLEKNLVVLDKANLSNQLSTHAVEWAQLLNSPYIFGFSNAGSIDSIGLALGWTQLAVLVLASLWLVIRVAERKFVENDRLLVLLLAVSWLYVLLQLPYFVGILQAVPLLRFIQFPWRLAMPISILLGGVTVLLLNHTQKSWQWWVGGLIVLQIIAMSRLVPVDYFHRTNVDYDAFPQSTTTANENLPKNFVYLDLGGWQPSPYLFAGDAVIQVERWSGSARRYQVEVIKTATIIEPTMNFAGWQSRADGQLLEYKDGEFIAGRIAYELAPGSYTVETKFTQQTPARMVGNGLSMVGGLLLLVALNFNKRLQTL